MPTCQICLRAFKSLKFQTKHISICARCVSTLNEPAEPAKNAQARWAEKLATGMRRNAERDLQAAEEWKRQKAQRTLSDLDSAVAAKLHNWITDLLKKPENSTRDARLMRAHRRGLLRMDGFADYPGDWPDVAHRIRCRDKDKQDDKYRCKACGATDTTLDVHHIIYLSHHGTNQQSNLVTLCRKCHEAEHKREFDGPEAEDPESVSPIRPPPDLISAAAVVAPIKNGLPEASARVALWKPIEEMTDAQLRASILKLREANLNQLNSGIDPEFMMDGMIIAGAYIESGIRDFSAYAKAMVADLGDIVKPYLKSWFAAISLDPRAVSFDGMTPIDDLADADLDAILASHDDIADQSETPMPEGVRRKT